MKKILSSLPVLLLAGTALAQQYTPADTIKMQELNEIIVVSNAATSYQKDRKALGSLDDYLQKSAAVNMIKRGAYAWEPMLNGMTSERSVITVDGMRIYQACTDKMDPITSYVENTNLSKANISHGAGGSAYGGTIAGSIDLTRRKGSFNENGWGGSLFSGFEANNQQKILGGTLRQSGQKFFTDLDLTYRDAGNYKDGNGNLLQYSQFTKLNFSNVTGVRINQQQHLESSLIFDKANHVGYPSLPMDVSLAQAIIASLQYSHKRLNPHISLWETKLYFNQITHIMDDSYRPDVKIRMDMPGKTKTWGAYSKLKGNSGNHQFQLTWSGHFNNSFAEMTMYPANQEEKPMYMLTWPDVNTMYSGIFWEDELNLNEHFKFKFTASAAVHQNTLVSEMGLSSLQIFYPELKSSKTRVLKSISPEITYHHKRFIHTMTLGYSDRAPSVSEAYGFYLFNSFDGWDYIGNPLLKNEKSVNIGYSSGYLSQRFIARFRSNYFHIMDYIIGKPAEGLLPMTLGAKGVKTYQPLAYTTIWNNDLELNYFPDPDLEIGGKISHRLGQDMDKIPLPLIQPFSYSFNVRYEKNLYYAELSLEGNTKHTRYSAEFGESAKDAYWIINAAASRKFKIYNQQFLVKAGVENLFDRYYSTFADWNNIPRMGRNLFINIIYNF